MAGPGRARSPRWAWCAPRGVWYLAGIPSAADVRFFRLDRAGALRDTGERVPHPDFDLQSAWREARDAFRAGLRPLSADLELDDTALAVLGGLCTLHLRERRDGWTSVHAEFGDLAHATEVLPRLLMRELMSASPA